MSVTPFRLHDADCRRWGSLALLVVWFFFFLIFAEETSFLRARETCKAVKKAGLLCMMPKLPNPGVAKELRFHGVQMAGPARNLVQSGTGGHFPGNIKRDMLRQIGEVAAGQRNRLDSGLRFLWTWSLCR